MAYSLLDEEWAAVRSLLPENFAELAWEYQAMRRHRGKVAHPETLLRLLLLHVGSGLSLEQSALRAEVQGLVALSDVALFKRLRGSRRWLEALNRHLWQSRLEAATLQAFSQRFRLRALDATYLQPPGAKGTSYRLHYSLRLPDLVCDFAEVTDAQGGEHLRRLPVQPGELVLADRGYNHAAGLAALLDAGADILMRLRPSALSLQNLQGRPLRLTSLLRRKKLRPGRILSKAVQLEYQGRCYRLRLLVMRQSHAAARRARKKIRAERQRKKGQVRPQTLFLAGYVFVLTSVSKEQLPAREAMDLYRCRWQVELAFKRLKSLLRMDELRNKKPESCQAWIQAKLLVALLTEKLLVESELFSPWGYPLHAPKPLEELS